MTDKTSPAQWPEDVVERVAKTLWEYSTANAMAGRPWKDADPIGRDEVLDMARVALATLPPPEDERVNGLIEALKHIEWLADDFNSPVMTEWDRARAMAAKDRTSDLPRQIMEGGLSIISEHARSALASYRGETK